MIENQHSERCHRHVDSVQDLDGELDEHDVVRMHGGLVDLALYPRVRGNCILKRFRSPTYSLTLF